MKLFEIEATLTGMVGKNYTYNKRPVTVLRFEIKEKIIRVVCATEDISILVEDFHDTIQRFLPDNTPAIAQDSKPVGSPPSAVPQTIIRTSGGELKELVMDNIKRIQRDKEYIPQAVEINNQVKTLIDLAKTEIELIKALRP